MRGQVDGQLTLFPEDFLASLSPQPGSDEARKTTVISGQKCSALYRRSGPLGLLVRMLLESSTWHSTQRFLTWKPKATPSRRLYFQLVPSVPRTRDTELQLWPTPKATLRGDCPSERRRRSPDLAAAVKMWTTPTATLERKPEKSIGGQLNPEWVEWLMGFPIGWTDLSVLETL